MTKIPHRFSEVLGFNKDFYEGMNHVAKLFFDILLLRDELIKSGAIHVSSTPNSFDMYNYSDNYLEGFIHWAFSLSDSGMHTFFLENLLMNARDSVLRKQSDANCDLLGLQLLFVISGVKLQILVGANEYYNFANHVVTSDFDISQIYDYFFSGIPEINPNSETHCIKV